MVNGEVADRADSVSVGSGASGIAALEDPHSEVKMIEIGIGFKRLMLRV